MDPRCPELHHTLLLDVETGGLDPTCHPILSVALRRFEGDWHPHPIEWLIREADDVLAGADPQSLALNGHDLDEVRRHGLSPREVALELNAYLDAHRDIDGRLWIIAHSATFDARWIERLFQLADLDNPPNVRWVCSMSMAWVLRIAKGRGPYGLSSLARRYGVPHEDAHTALGDVETLAHVLPCLLDEVRPQPRSHTTPDDDRQETLL